MNEFKSLGASVTLIQHLLYGLRDRFETRKGGDERKLETKCTVF